MSLQYLPYVKPSAIAIGTIFTQAATLSSGFPIIGAAINKAKTSDTPEEFLRTRESASALALYGASVVGSGLQTYATAALLQLTGTLTYKGAAYLGGLVFAISAVPQLVTAIVIDKRPSEYVLGRVLSSLFETVGLALTLNWWGTRDI
ncbi:hypothetical protein CANCADRAFT_4404 [Tortispora caseinolytica NRRL Y-17796]|uniref:DUF1761-domain-containing protein n=1 Tax=Tortispora caseinolytica NRRL Y-17796 TaxID=767744 RepID=A0A1E4TDP6_9ASCO|nr:hypothetical protein CANCADRAFT_4404 [Tortispora caseinolytica NRRL Y-17796]